MAFSQRYYSVHKEILRIIEFIINIPELRAYIKSPVIDKHSRWRPTRLEFTTSFLNPRSKLHNKRQEGSAIRLNNLLQPIAQDSPKSPTLTHPSSLLLKKKFAQSYQQNKNPEFHKTSTSLNPNLRNSSTNQRITKDLDEDRTKNSFAVLQDSKRAYSSSKDGHQPSKKNNKKNISYGIRQYLIKLEMINLAESKSHLSGVYILPSFSSLSGSGFFFPIHLSFLIHKLISFLPLVWYGCLFLYHGLWNGGIFKFKVVFPEEYPEATPEIYFMTQVSHPLINPVNGFYNLSTFFPKWIPYEHNLFLALTFVKNSFKNSVLNSIKPEYCLNRNSYKLLKEDIKEFVTISQRDASNSKSSEILYKSEDPDCTMVFHKTSDSEYGKNPYYPLFLHVHYLFFSSIPVFL
ncbi:Protein crossbronx-like protein [Smittium mucronatum]|uniref:Protein crossbronx-like protein n=1 Tax=Smittium mucronatum TaxID=133383 RepID=A0A1R0GPP6_9FUNG|nr:Protein crossbronx-like protein [Smittium mucronatum]